MLSMTVRDSRRCECVAVSAAVTGSSSQKPFASPVCHVTVREVDAMTDRSAAVRRLFRDDVTDSRVNSMLIRTGKVSSVNNDTNNASTCQPLSRPTLA